VAGEVRAGFWRTTAKRTTQYRTERNGEKKDFASTGEGLRHNSEPAQKLDEKLAIHK